MRTLPLYGARGRQIRDDSVRVLLSAAGLEDGVYQIDRGELPDDIDPEYAADLIFGPFWYRLLVGHTPLAPAEAPSHVRTVLAGLQAQADDPTRT